jgi:hypothetical protein
MIYARVVLIGSVLVIATGMATTAKAQRVDANACKAFEEEKAQLETTNIAEDIERGAEWAQANLSPERLRQVARYIFLQEKLTFQCPSVLAAAAVQKVEEQARLKALADVERARRWEERMSNIVPPDRKPDTKVARARSASGDDAPPLPTRKSQ